MMQRLPILLAAGISLLFSASGQAQSTVEGRVQLPKPSVAAALNRRYDVHGEPAVAAPNPPSAVVYLEGKFPLPHPGKSAQMAQKNIAFVTPLLPVMVGTTVEFPNEDGTYHSIFSFSKTKRFDLGRYRSDERPVPSQVFDKPGVVTLRCDIHEQMRGIILVLESPYFTRTDGQGNYRLENLPSGHYKLKAWLDSNTTLEKDIDLKAGATVRVDFP